MNLFDWDKPPLKITKPVRLIELFAGIGAQAKAFERLGVPFEHYRICELDRFAVDSYNAVHGTDFAVSDIRGIHAEDLGIKDTDKYCYVLTYSFPCQDLSNAGKQRGMKRGTRSGLLWEVERLLRECKELPQILLMENVPAVVGEKNIDDFAVWCSCLEELGYTNAWEILNSKDYGVPQNRDRCFMVSFLGDYQYEFPPPIPLTKTMDDLLEPDVDEKFYLKGETADKLCSQLIQVERERESKSHGTGERESIQGHETRLGYCHGASICRSRFEKKLTVARTIAARDHKGLSNQVMNGVYVRTANKDGRIGIRDGGVCDLTYPQSQTRRGRVIDGGDTSPTLMGSMVNVFKVEIEHEM